VARGAQAPVGGRQGGTGGAHAAGGKGRLIFLYFHLIMSVQWPGMPQSLALEQLHMLVAEVFPKVRQG
jgi:hypothetical protein